MLADHNIPVQEFSFNSLNIAFDGREVTYKEVPGDVPGCRVNIDDFPDVGIMIFPAHSRGVIDAVVSAPGKNLSITGVPANQITDHEMLRESLVVRNLAQGSEFLVRHKGESFKITVRKGK